MIYITYDPDALRVEVTGHAGAAPKGEDLVCCAVSVLVQALSCTGRRVGAVEEQIRPGAARVELRPYPLQWMEAVQRYQAVIDGLRMVAECYPEHVQMAAEARTYATEKTC